MGGCWSQQSIDNEAMLAAINASPAVEQPAGEIVHDNAGQVTAEGGSSEYVGAYMRNGIEQQNAVEPLIPVSNEQMEQPVLHVSPDEYQNPVETVLDIPLENTGRTSVDQPIYQTFEEQPMEERIAPSKIYNEQPVTLPVPENLVEEPLPYVSSDVHYNYQTGDEPVVDVPIETMMTPVVDDPVYPPLEVSPIVEQTLHNQYIEEQPVNEETVHSQIYEEQPVHTLSFGDEAVLPAQLCETEASFQVNENYQVSEALPVGHDLGVAFEGRMYRTRVFDPNLNDYVYVGGDDLQPRGGLVMWRTVQKYERYKRLNAHFLL